MSAQVVRYVRAHVLLNIAHRRFDSDTTTLTLIKMLFDYRQQRLNRFTTTMSRLLITFNRSRALCRARGEKEKSACCAAKR